MCREASGSGTESCSAKRTVMGTERAGKGNGALQVMHVIAGLDIGGAEGMMARLLGRLESMGVNSTVVSMTDIGSIGTRLVERGIPVHSLGMRRGVPNVRGISALRRAIRDQQPDILQSWMYHADLLSGLANRIGPRRPLVWNIRHSNLNLREDKKLTIATARVCALLSSRLPDRIICCADSAKREHIRIGYPAQKLITIPNGFDTSQYRRDDSIRRRVRDALGITDELTIGVVGRFSKQKDYPTFTRAAGILSRQPVRVIFVMAGRGMSWDNEQLVGMIKDNGVEENVRLLGARNDISDVICAFDIATSSSKYGEGFSNVIGEAMSCEVPCVVTDVGDSGSIIGDTGEVVEPGNPEVLADAWRRMLEYGPEQRRRLGEKARRRIKDNYGLDVVAEKYYAIYRDMSRDVRS